MITTFGLDIGTTSIKVCKLKKNGKAFQLDSVIVAPNTTKGIMSESLVDQQKLANSLRDLIARAGIKEKSVNVSLPESQVYTKIIEMPLLSDKELTAALKWEMEQYIPLPLDQVKTDWQVLTKIDEKEKKGMYVLLVAAPIAVLEKYEKILTQVDLTGESIETEILSVQRALSPLLTTKAANLILHIGASASIIAVVRDQILQMVFPIGLGGTAITRAISADLGIDLAQAENYKKAYGLNQQAFEGKIGKALSPILESITGDIRKALLLYKEKYKEEISQIILSGGTALLPGIDAYFTNSLNTQIVIGNCWDLYGITNIPNELRLEAPSFNVVFGLALRDLI